jgi:glycosyltransferase involved in cell wall biosynthesis
VLYEGSFNPGRWLAELAQSAEYLPDDTKLVFVGETSRWWKYHVEPLLKNPPLSNKTAIGPWIPHEELLNYVADADVGIIIYDDKLLNNYYCEPGKLSDYVLAGVPVVAPDFPTISPVILRYGIGSIFSSPQPIEIAKAITEALMMNKDSLNSALSEARKELVWETQRAKFLEAIEGT